MNLEVAVIIITYYVLFYVEKNFSGIKWLTYTYIGIVDTVWLVPNYILISEVTANLSRIIFAT